MKRSGKKLKTWQMVVVAVLLFSLIGAPLGLLVAGWAITRSGGGESESLSNYLRLGYQFVADLWAD